MSQSAYKNENANDTSVEKPLLQKEKSNPAKPKFKYNLLKIDEHAFDSVCLPLKSHFNQTRKIELEKQKQNSKKDEIKEGRKSLVNDLYQELLPKCLTDSARMKITDTQSVASELKNIETQERKV